MKLNYFKDFDEVVEDFKRLTTEEQHEELLLVRRNYEKQHSDDFVYLGKLTAQTKLTKKLLDLLEEAYNNK
ncbi:hypothetical protein D0T49_02005 [Paludibacter sp. 221]|uniref:hypothetical protein n=1 Tax=Paludibacter sp. 221 TaxID=2302939 RepID=UPI0013D5A18A|nr:hypothetical protein [Paludibacter sp. 221]NDV45824.1 hypothetical protein [Paludibacter sp. 221]